MIPILYEKDETEFVSNGIGRLSDTTLCDVTERLNDIYTLDLQYPANGQYANDITPGRLILAKPNDADRAQPFRIYEVDRTLRGIIVAKANHISYDLNYYPMRVYTAHTCAGAVAALSSRAVIPSGFTFETDITASADWVLKGAASIRSCMGGNNGLTSVYGGEWYFDRYSCELKERRGDDTGAAIRYGTNLTDLDATSDDVEYYTGALAFYNGSSYVSSDIQYSDSAAVPQKILIVDHTSDFNSAPTTAQLNTLAAKDLSMTLGAQESITVSFVPTIEHLKMGDFVKVIYEKYDIATKLEVVQTVYNVLVDRYKEIELGAIRQTLSDIIAGLK